MDLIGSTEAAQIAGITPSTFRSLVARGDKGNPPVPKPAVKVPRRTLWKRKDIEAWAAVRQRGAGRPPKR